jgi:formate-dependent nitrite reductase membrane component NrfD
MAPEIFWGLPVVLYLFLAGLGAGALTVSSSAFLRGGGGETGMHFDIARYGAFLAPIPVMVGCGLLVFELGSFHVGDWFKWLNLYKTINLSPMSIGTWLLTFFIVTSLAYAYTFLPKPPVLGEKAVRWRRPIAWLNVPLGIGVAVYTGVLLGAMPSRPFWNSPVLALLFLLSSLSTGVALILLARAILGPGGEKSDATRGSDYHTSGYILTTSDLLLLGIELLIVFLFIMFAYLAVGDVRHAITVILSGGDLATLFWLGFVVIGLLVPAAIELYYVVPRLLFHREYAPPRGVEMAVSVGVLIGGFLLRYVVVIAGQITGPVGV